MTDEAQGYEVGITADRNNPGLRKIKSNGQQESYLVLSAEERAKGFVMPVRECYRHIKCRTDTRMSQAIAETYARNPKFYGGTFCCSCGKHFPLLDEEGKRAFVWLDRMGGPGVNAFVGENPEDLERRREEELQKYQEIMANTVAAWPEARRNDALIMYCIYVKPADYPDKIVTRKFIVTDKAEPADHLVHDTVEQARQALPAGLYRIPRNTRDEPQILETWI